MRKAFLFFRRERPVIGALHLLPLPGSPKFGGDSHVVVQAALQDAEALLQGGVDAILIENFGDTPFFPGRVPSETVAWMTRIGSVIRDRYDLPLGLCVLRNDACRALAIAHSIDAQFIRVCILASPRVTDQGLIQGVAYRLLRERARLHANVKIFADVDIKHSYPLAAGYSLESDAADLVARSHADALIVTGPATGRPIQESHLYSVQKAADVPVFIGSGITHRNVDQLIKAAGGIIVGMAFKQSENSESRVDVEKVRAIVQRIDASGE